MVFKNLGSDRIWRKIKFFIVFLLGNPLFPDMDAFFKKSVENKASTENLQKTYKNQYYLIKNIRENNSKRGGLEGLGKLGKAWKGLEMLRERLVNRDASKSLDARRLGKAPKFV